LMPFQLIGGKGITSNGYAVSSAILCLISPLIWFGHAADNAGFFAPAVMIPGFLCFSRKPDS